MVPELWDNGAPQGLLAADGTPRLPSVAYDDDGYPFADDQPLAQNSPQADQLFYAFPALKSWLRRRFPDAFAASDMLVYPRQGDLKASLAPDVLVAFGAGDHPRDSYRLREGEPVPAFVFEVLSGTSADNDLGEKRGKYAAMGVTEFWVFDPFGNDIAANLSGFSLRVGVYEPVPPLPGTDIYRSDVLGIEFRSESGDLRIHNPVAGEDLKSLDEERDGRLAAKAQAREEANARAAAEAELARLRRMTEL